MKRKEFRAPLSTLFTGAIVAGAIMSANAMENASNGFEDLGTGAELRANLLSAPSSPFKSTEAKCGEGKCGEEKQESKAAEHKCGEGKCGEGKCGNEHDKNEETPAAQTPEKKVKHTREDIGAKPKNEIKKPK